MTYLLTYLLISFVFILSTDIFYKKKIGQPVRKPGLQAVREPFSQVTYTAAPWCSAATALTVLKILIFHRLWLTLDYFRPMIGNNLDLATHLTAWWKIMQIWRPALTVLFIQQSCAAVYTTSLPTPSKRPSRKLNVVPGIHCC